MNIFRCESIRVLSFHGDQMLGIRVIAELVNSLNTVTFSQILKLQQHIINMFRHFSSYINTGFANYKRQIISKSNSLNFHIEVLIQSILILYRLILQNLPQFSIRNIPRHHLLKHLHSSITINSHFLLIIYRIISSF